MCLEQLQDKKNNKITQKKYEHAIKQYKTNFYMQSENIVLKVQKTN